MVALGMRVIQTHRELLCSKVISQTQIKLKKLFSAARDRRYRIVRLSVCLGKNHRRLIGITAPFFKDTNRKLSEPFGLFTADPDNRHRPFDNSALNVLKAFGLEMLLYLCPLHSEGVVTALKMVMA